MDLSDIIQAAHGGSAISSIASQFGLSPEQASAAINALAPALSHGLQNKLQDPNGFGQIVGHLNDPAHQASYGNADAAQAPDAANSGGDLLNQIFGNSAAVGQIAQHIGSETGINPEVLNQLMPVVASMAMGGVAKTMQEGGFGGVLSQLGGAAGQGGGLGGIFSSVVSAATGQGGQSGGLGGMIGGIVGSLFGGHAAPTAGAPAAPGAPAAGGLDPALVQAGMSALSGLFQSGGGSAGLQNVLGQILAKR
jgi:hypothetical protein